MADEQQFIHDGLRRQQIDEFFADELGRAGYGGMELANTPMGTQIVLRAEKPGMVIGKGGRNIRNITTEIEDRFGLEDPQIDVQEVDEPDLNGQIVADRLANALERGWYFRKAGHTTVDRIMDSGALGAEIVLAGKVTGARSRVAKFNRGYIKHNGEPADALVDRGDGVAVMKLGTIGVTVKLIRPGADLPDDFRIMQDADISGLEPEEVPGDEVSDLLEEPETEDGEPDLEAGSESETAEADSPAEAADAAEEIVEEAVEVDTGESASAPDAEGGPEAAEPEAAGSESEPVSEDAAAEAEDLMAEMEATEAEIEAEESNSDAESAGGDSEEGE
ncbi:30S ribosomal protein S3 [Halobacteriales archaeon QS_3_64_16]|nr:MAG: 30S ribosomal protein S3 [Halobacteriales archaeon QS_3_64_16]